MQKKITYCLRHNVMFAWYYARICSLLFSQCTKPKQKPSYRHILTAFLMLLLHHNTTWRHPHSLLQSPLPNSKLLFGFVYFSLPVTGLLLHVLTTTMTSGRLDTFTWTEWTGITSMSTTMQLCKWTFNKKTSKPYQYLQVKCHQSPSS